MAAIAVDGKSMRGTFSRTGGAGVHLLAALSHTTGDDRTEGIVLAQRQVEQKTSEIAWFAPMLDQIDLTNTVVTADALHTTRDHARYLVERGGHYVFTVKENQHRLFDLLDSLPWHEIPTATTQDSDHGRTERRTIQLAPLGNYLGYPVIDSRMRHTHIENRLHWVRDVTYAEDHSRVRTDHAPRVMATLRNFAINTLRHNGWDNIAKGLRHMARNPTRPLTLLGIPT